MYIYHKSDQFVHPFSLNFYFSMKTNKIIFHHFEILFNFRFFKKQIIQCWNCLLYFPVSGKKDISDSLTHFCCWKLYFYNYIKKFFFCSPPLNLTSAFHRGVRRGTPHLSSTQKITNYERYRLRNIK